jgi:hypothetical protein
MVRSRSESGSVVVITGSRLGRGIWVLAAIVAAGLIAYSYRLYLRAPHVSDFYHLVYGVTKNPRPSGTFGFIVGPPITAFLISVYGLYRSFSDRVGGNPKTLFVLLIAFFSFVGLTITRIGVTQNFLRGF